MLCYGDKSNMQNNFKLNEFFLCVDICAGCLFLHVKFSL